MHFDIFVNILHLKNNWIFLSILESRKTFFFKKNDRIFIILVLKIKIEQKPACSLFSK